MRIRGHHLTNPLLVFLLVLFRVLFCRTMESMRLSIRLDSSTLPPLLRLAVLQAVVPSSSPSRHLLWALWLTLQHDNGPIHSAFNNHHMTMTM